MQVDDEVSQLIDIFPGIPTSVFHRMIVEDKLTVEAAIDTLLNNDDARPTETTTSLGKVLKQHSDTVMDNTEDVHIIVARSCIWNKAKVFYKAALNKPQVLRKNLVVQFSGEEGVDLGALKKRIFRASSSQHFIRDIRGTVHKTTSKVSVQQQHGTAYGWSSYCSFSAPRRPWISLSTSGSI